MNLINQCKNAFTKLKDPIRICKICFLPIRTNNLYAFIHENEYLCANCCDFFKPKFIKFKIDDINALSIYEYDEGIQTYLYQLKGCYDYELYPVFLYRFKNELRIKYKGYSIIPAPSYREDDDSRGFNHVQTIFSLLRLPILDIIEKTSKVKQSNNSSEQRKEISKHLRVKNNVDLSNKKVLIVDDVYTTGSTIKAMINLVKTLHPKHIEVLVMSKTKYKSPNKT